MLCGFCELPASWLAGCLAILVRHCHRTGSLSARCVFWCRRMLPTGPSTLLGCAGKVRVALTKNGKVHSGLIPYRGAYLTHMVGQGVHVAAGRLLRGGRGRTFTFGGPWHGVLGWGGFSRRRRLLSRLLGTHSWLFLATRLLLPLDRFRLNGGPRCRCSSLRLNVL